MNGNNVSLTNAETADSAWKSLYRVGGTAALIQVVLIPIQIIVFIAGRIPAKLLELVCRQLEDGLDLGVVAGETP